ncbi:MAG: DNA polymerase III subunit delta [Thermoguttaceae bacterium]
MADKATAALDYLGKPEKYPPKPVCAVFGDESFLRRQVILGLRAAVLGGDEGDFSLSTFEGRGAVLRDVLDDLATLAMFGAGRRLAVVEEADPFVSRYRAELEDYVARPSATGVLVLDVNSLPSNTRLYKSIAAEGLLIDCGTPAGGRLTKWLSDWARQRQNVQLPAAAADMLVETIGPELGLLDQELAKLALLAGEDRKITPEMVKRSVGGWRTKTTWEMLDAAMDGNVPEAMLQLDRLLASGEQPVGLLGQISASLRRLAAATRLIVQAETAGRRPNLRSALEQAGVRSFVLQKTERQLKLLGRHRGVQLYRWLLEADLDLKGESTMPPRLILERLIVRMAAPQSGPKGAPASLTRTLGQSPSRPFRR